GRTDFHGDAGNAGYGKEHRSFRASDGSYARHVDARADGGPAQGEGRGVRSPLFDGDDSASQWGADHGEGSVRYAGSGAGCRVIQLRDGCGQLATGRDKDYAVHVGEETVGVEEKP